MSIRPSYKEAIQYLYDIEKYGMNLGLKRVEALLKSLDNPQDKFPIIHVGGTNGKGSTSAMIASILVEAGYKAGLYTSPHLMRFNERIRINHREISDKKVAELVERIRQRTRGNGETEKRRNGEIEKSIPRFPDSPIPPFPLTPTFFEFTTAMAFLYFAEEKVDIAVMEVGLGGRLDATNVGKPMVSVITNIAKDHEAILGNRIKDIAFEKAGIIKKGGVLISGETKPAALKVLISECKRKKAVFYRFNKDFYIEEGIGIRKSSPLPVFKGRRWYYKNLKINLLGRHQYLNAASALAALEVLEETCPRMFLSGKGFYIPESAVRKGLRNVFWPGRIEIVSKRPLVVLDCAHNPAGAEVLKDALLDLRFAIGNLRMKNKNNNSKIENRKSKMILVLGIMADKDIKGILAKLAPLAHTVILTRPKTERASSLEALYSEIMKLRIRNYELRIPNRKSKIVNRKLKIMLIEDVADACRTAISMANADDIICISGSIFTVGEAREAFRQLQIGNCKVQNVKLEKGKP